MLLFVYFIVLSFSLVSGKGSIHGQYTLGITNYDVVLPRKLKSNGAFYSFSLPHFYEGNLRNKRNILTDSVHYSVRVDGEEKHLQLIPNLRFVSPSLVIERRREGKNLSHVEFSRPSKHLCHYTGFLRDDPKRSRAAISTCSGLVGVINSSNGTFFIEPILGRYADINTGEHLHVVYKRSSLADHANCGTRRDWWNSWGEELYFNKKHKNLLSHKVRRAAGMSTPHYIKTLAVVDKKFLNHHREINVEEYILVIHNIISDYYHDHTIGHMIDVVLIRVIYLLKEEEEIDLTINRDAGETLDSFCKWQNGINPTSVNHPNHHDVAVLITRHDLCSTGSSSCGLLGLAYVGTACNSHKNCAITEDTGLTLALTMAHEVGHNMGCSHDTPGDSGCDGKLPDNKMTIMSPSANSYIGGWSNCSREFIRSLLNTGLGDCLFDEPQEHQHNEMYLLPGATYNYDQQCKFIWGDSFAKCGLKTVGDCDKLWCKRIGSTSCSSEGTVVADGTECGNGKWCFNGDCIQEGQRLKAINGGWASWGSWGSCSRTCGGGVRMRERLCSDPQPENGGKYCIGSFKEFEMCSTKNCKNEGGTFRELQCTEQNNIPFQGRTYSWKPYLSDSIDTCNLYCINNENLVVKFKTRVRDGTRCRPGYKDTCVQGSCLSVGCDWIIQSGSVEDICGVCNGDGTHCTVHREIYNKKSGHGYSKILNIPRGSLNIEIKELDSSENMIAIGKTDQDQYFNAKNTEQIEGQYTIGGTTALYTKPSYDTEELIIKGPTEEDITVFYDFFKGDNPGVSLQWVTPSEKSEFKAKYHWEYLDWDECSLRCGGGSQICRPSCVESTVGKVNSTFCRSDERPDIKSRNCNIQPCRTKWKVFKWGECSGCDGGSGYRRRQVSCIMENPTDAAKGDDIIVEDSLCCSDYKPPDTEVCTSAQRCMNSSTSANRYRWKNDVDDDFLNFVYNKRGLDNFLSSYFRERKHSVTHFDQPIDISTECITKSIALSKDNASNESSTTKEANNSIAIDRVDETKFRVRTVDVIPNKNSVMNLSETVFEDEGNKLPKVVPNSSISDYTGTDAMKKMKELSQKIGQDNGTETN